MGAVREYYYEIDRDGRLWHDGTELSDARFLDFFFTRLRVDETAVHEGYPFVSPCAGERNYVRAAVTPIVFQRLGDDDRLGYAATLAVPFEPAALRSCARGFLHHPAPVGGRGILRPSLTASLADRLQQTRDGILTLEHRGTRHRIGEQGL